MRRHSGQISCDGLILHVRENMSVGVQRERCAGVS
jgi:hypothetical protein